MSCERWREAMALSFYGELGAAEGLELEAHLEGCPACREERGALAATVDLLRREDAATARRCDLFQERIALSLYGELPETEARGLEAHLAECGACRSAREALGGTVALLRSAEPRGRRRLWAAAAALLLAAGSALLIAGWPTQSASPAVTQEPASSAGPAPGAALIAEDRLCAAAVGDDLVRALDAVERLGRTGSRRSTRSLRLALARPPTRLAAFRALRAQGELDPRADAIPALADPVLRREAASVLAAERTTEAFEALLAVGDATCRAACRSFRPEIAIPALVAAASREECRAAAVELLLTAWGDEARHALLALARGEPALAQAAFRRASDIRDAGADRFLVLALADVALSGDAAEALAAHPVRRFAAAYRAALAEDALRTAAAAHLAGRAADPAARDLLAPALAHDGVRAIAAAPFLRAGDLRAFDAILAAGYELPALETLSDPARRRGLSRALRSSKLRAGAVAAILDRDASLWRDLVPLLKREDLRGDAAAALARCGAERAIPSLIPWVSREGEGARVREALVALSGVDAGDSPERWTRWWNEKPVNP